MKYNININQLALCELSTDMDVNDAAILDYLITMCRSQNEKIDNKRIIDKDGQSWTWVDLRSLLEDMPLLRIVSRAALSTRLQKIERNGFITTLKKRVNGHICLYVKTDRKVDSLYVKTDRALRVDVQEVEKPVRETGPIINTSNTIHNNTKPLELFEEFWKVYPVKKAKKPSESIWLRKINPDIGQLIIEDVRKRTASDRQWLAGYIPHPTTYLNQERWNDEITMDRPIVPNFGSDQPYTKGKYVGEEEFVVNNKQKI